MAVVGIVVIGRNEGDRLKVCLQSALRSAVTVVYVDSGSSDGSAETAKGLGVCVVELGTSLPLGPSRARNEGVTRLLQLDPKVKFIQFVDGDCELVDQWIDVGLRQLQNRPEVAVVCGRLRERFPSASVYNRLCDIEWDQPAGETLTSGGICMTRVDAFQQVGGFDENVIAGEEPELCFRLRQRGWKIFRVSDEMALHDSAMTRFRQWWRRAIRCGHAYAQGARLHGSSPERHYVYETRRAWAWGFLLPVLAVSAAWPSGGKSLFLLLLYPAQMWRIYRMARRRSVAPTDAAAYGVLAVVSKFAEIYGVWKFAFRQIRGAPIQLIEHR